MSNFADTIDQEFPAAWRPDQKDSGDPNPIIGEFVEMQTANTDYGATYVMVLRLEDGSEKAVWLLHTVLKNELARVKPKPGETVGIKYLGKQKTAEGSKFDSYIGYRVKVDRPQGEAFDWAKLGAEPETEEFQTEPPETASEPVTVPVGAGDDGIPF